MPLAFTADEYPIHQAALSMRYAGTTDRNFYDRYYFNAHDRTGDVFVVSGMGVYPALGVTDAFVTVRRGDKLTTVRCSDALGDDRLNPSVGPYRIEVIEPLQKLRVVCDTDEHGIGLDLTWEGSFPAVEEQPHVIRHGARTILDAQRFAQVGSWSGVLRVDGEEITVDPAVWLGTRDRSWGTRPIGEPDAGGRTASEPPGGFYWIYAPLRFEEFMVIVIVGENGEGYRTLNDATRVWPDGRVEQLGWPRIDISYKSGTRHPERAALHVTDADGKPFTIEVETLGFVPLHLGSGYAPDADWQHGRWMGPGWVSPISFDVTDPAVAPRIPFGTIDHVARATIDGAEGWGLFEHACIGPHKPTGFAEFTDVAP